MVRPPITSLLNIVTLSIAENKLNTIGTHCVIHVNYSNNIILFEYKKCNFYKKSTVTNK